MAHIEIHGDGDLDEPTLVEGLPGVGLVGKIAVDHLVDTLEMEYYAACHCDGLARAAAYDEGDRALRPPVRIYADQSRDLLALQSDVPVSPDDAPEFSTCLMGWLADTGGMAVCLSGLPQDRGDQPNLYGVGVGDGRSMLDRLGVDAPAESGLISGPTGALLAEALEQNLDAVGLIVEANKQFPDPRAARVILEEAIAGVAGPDVETARLADQAEEIAAAREKLARQMQQADDESSQAQPLGMYQ
jgi:uncharacterized protein